MNLFSKNLIFFILIAGSAMAQKHVSGVVLDKLTGESLPFASVSWKNHLSGTVTNEEGKFELIIPPVMISDTLLISYLGYRDRQLTGKEITDSQVIHLQPDSFVLEEIEIRPRPPEFYLKLAIRSIPDNYPDTSFSTQGYYSERIKENGYFVKHNEAIFKSYYPSYLDTTPNQHRLMLFRKDEEERELQFMRQKVEKDKEKERKKAGKNDEEFDEEEHELINVEKFFGGPELILAAGNIYAGEGFLDSTQFDDYEFSFGPEGTPDLLAIHFESKKVIDHVVFAGEIFIDIKTDAIKAINYEGKIKIPLWASPLLFVYGLSIKDPVFRVRKRFRKIKNTWYPEKVRLEMTVNMTKKYLFKKNEHSDMQLFQVFSINRYNFDNPFPVPEKKRYDPKKEFSSQVFNDENLSWEEINVIKN